MGKFVRESPGCYHDDGDVVCDLELPYQPYQTLPTKYPSTRSCFENFTSRRRRPYALIHCPRNLFDTQDSCNYTGLTDSCNLSPAASVRHLFSSVQFNHPLALQCLEAQQHLCTTYSRHSIAKTSSILWSIHWPAGWDAKGVDFFLGMEMFFNTTWDATCPSQDKITKTFYI